MAKEVQISIKMEQELRDEFMAVAAVVHRPAAQIIRELMRSYITRQEQPNAETIAALAASEKEEMNSYASADALYRSLGI